MTSPAHHWPSLVSLCTAIVALQSAARAQALPGGTLDPTTIPKFVMPVVILPAMPSARANCSEYQIAARQFRQQMLPPPLPMTTVFGYGSIAAPGTLAAGGSFHVPALTIEARWHQPVTVQWINDLRDPASGNYVPHLLPVDPTLHWANPPGGDAGRDSRPTFTATPGPYTGPVPTVVHVHGAHTSQESDGYPEAWTLPVATDIPPGHAMTGTYYDAYRQTSPFGPLWQPGTLIASYPNDQRPATLWYHDHALGLVRVNIHAGMYGFYLIRGGPQDRVRTTSGRAAVLPEAPFEVALAIQDRSFNTDGSMFFPDSRAFFDGFTGPYIPFSDVAPIHNPEFFGNTIAVNGRTWPYMEVEQCRYRFRLLNVSNARFLILEASEPAVAFWQIGADGGCLEAPEPRTRLLIGPAERLDVIADFTNVPVGARITLRNVGPDEPFGGGEPGVAFAPADPATTGQVMQFRVLARSSADATTPPQQLVLPEYRHLAAPSCVRRVSLNELDSAMLPGVGPMGGFLGTVDGAGATLTGAPLMWADAVTEHPARGATEVWEICNFTEDAHPIHVHLVQFEIVGREIFDTGAGTPGTILPPEPGESGTKDTVIAYPGQITRIKARFDVAGRYVWHCHITDHEDNEMMRAFLVGR